MNIFRNVLVYYRFKYCFYFLFLIKLKGKESLNIDSILQLHDSLFLDWITLFESRSNEHFSFIIVSNIVSISFFYEIKRKGEFEYRFFFILGMNNFIRKPLEWTFFETC